MTDDPRTAKKHHLRVLEPVREYKAQLAKSRTVDTSALVGNPEDGVIRSDSPSGPVTLTDPDQLAWIQHCKRAAVDFIYFANFMCGVRVHPGQIKVAQESLYGEVPESVMVKEGPIEYDVDMRKGQKTGLFLDQRENREAALRYARGRLLDDLFHLLQRLAFAAGA